MGIATFTEEFVSPVPAQKLFKALALDNDKLLPQLIPQAIKSIETIQGDGGPGPELKLLKQRIDGIDKEKMTFSYTFIEGDALIDKVESISHEIKLENLADGGCKVTDTSKYNTKPEILEIKEEDTKDGKAMGMAVFKAVEGYLLANPHVYA
ncbi:hypothetical protein COLO4_03598 [Corchorus olitorius]|uniref:Bet v I/Major latex protein domain-containing protein n=1 Tax=Corchorus olitorius TaxID=93759 RepID=A0A1R3KXW0_9ROSI|nr:hypothetical protein COLO4_03598 [Corchorus olitorius]